MTATITKRQQARNEQALQELIQTVPGNDRCADCAARNPGWASWNLGIFLCMRCASIHRKLGTHISKVKSLSMDAWNTEQVANMKRIGNVASNRQYNARNVKPNIPIDADEVDGAVERFIRDKYQHRRLGNEPGTPASRRNTESGEGTDVGEIADGERPAPAPRLMARLGLRAASATFPFNKSIRSKAANRNGPSHLAPSDEPPSPSRTSKTPSGQVAGRRKDLDGKVDALKEMGFKDEMADAQALRDSNGDVARAIELLVTRTTNDDDKQDSVNMSRQGSQQAESRARLQTQAGHQEVAIPPASQQPTRAASQPQPQSQPSYNPFFAAAQPLDQSFQNMYISKPVAPQQMATVNSNPWATAMSNQSAPPTATFFSGYQSMTTAPQMFEEPATYQQPPFEHQQKAQVAQQNHQDYNNHPYGSVSQQSVPMSNSYGGNPWMMASVGMTARPVQPQPQAQANTNPFLSAQQSGGYPLFAQSEQASSTRQGHAGYGQTQLQQQQQQQYAQQPQDSHLQQSQYQQPQAQPQHHLPSGRHDKTSILALYAHPQLAPTRPSGIGFDSTGDAAPHQQQQQRSATMPLPSTNPFGFSGGSPQTSAGSKNPFATAGPTTTLASGAQGRHKHSQESVDLMNAMDAHGRWSPDAFSGLSSRAT